MIACLIAVPIHAKSDLYSVPDTLESPSGFGVDVKDEASGKDNTQPMLPLSESKAYKWAVGGTLLPVITGTSYILYKVGNASDRRQGGIFSHAEVSSLIGLFSLGAIIGPSLGEIYADSWGYGLLGIGLRIGSILPIFTVSTSDDLAGPFLATTILYIGATTYSFIDTHYAVKRANAKINAQRFGFSPELFPSSNGGLNPGMLAWLKF